MQRHRIELVKIKMPIVVHVALAQYLLGNIRRNVTAITSRYESLQLMYANQSIIIRVVLQLQNILCKYINLLLIQ